MILFVLEGKKREPYLCNVIQSLFFPEENESIICSFGNNIYELYKELCEYGGDGDIVSLLMEKFSGKEDNPFKNIDRSSDFSEIYLFFDYDFHNINLPLKELDKQIREMLDMFDDETENGKLYINYPMIESIRYTKELPDPKYYSYYVLRKDCKYFKSIAAGFSAYKSLDFIQIDSNKKPSEQKLKQLNQNWQYLKEQNVCKANYICSNSNSMPTSKEEISQSNIFEGQIKKYVSTSPCKVSILNSIPLFLFDYFK
jgi:hypothetical protein